jgi:hypothetical protein
MPSPDGVLPSPSSIAPIGRQPEAERKIADNPVLADAKDTLLTAYAALQSAAKEFADVQTRVHGEVEGELQVGTRAYRHRRQRSKRWRRGRSMTPMMISSPRADG